jgi:hypothetical protein
MKRSKPCTKAWRVPEVVFIIQGGSETPGNISSIEEFPKYAFPIVVE